MKKIVLILIGVSVTIFADFSRSGDIVTDNETNLQWQDDTDAKTLTKTWQEAIDYCETSPLGGNSDWRLPNLNELTSLVDDTKYNPAISSTFQNIASASYWSSTAYTFFTNSAWHVYFYGGVQDYSYTYYKGHYVRCVRAGQ